MIIQQPFLKRNFTGQSYIVQDTSSNSPYIEIPEIPEYLGGGVNVIKFFPSTVNLHTLFPVEVEVLDANGNAVRTEIPEFRDRFGYYYVSIYVYDSTAEGYGSISFVGVANATPQGDYLEYDQTNTQGFNMILTKQILIQPFERNTSPLIFDRPPEIQVAQVIAPATMTGTATVPLGKVNRTLRFITAPNEGFDKVNASSKDIQDVAIRSFALKNQGKSSTSNEINTVVRQEDYDIQGGYLASDVNRFKTVVKLQGAFEFSNTYRGARILLSSSNSYTNTTRSLSNTAVFSETNPYNDYRVPGTTQSIAKQLEQYEGTVIRIVNNKTCLVDKPLQVNIESYSSTRKDSLKRKIKHTYQQAVVDTKILFADNAAFANASRNPNAQSVNVSQSYLQFTFLDLAPIGGAVHRIKSYYRQNSLNGDYTIISDQRVIPTEYLTEAKYPNNTIYGREITPFFMFGHITALSVIYDFWSGYMETSTNIDTYLPTRNVDVLMESIKFQTDTATSTAIVTTKNYQTYQKDQAFTLGFNCTLDPYTKLELYVNSKTLSTQTYGQMPFAQAFEDSKNIEKDRYPGNVSRFGQLIGTIENNSSEQKDYGKVVFDFLANYDGFGRPLFRAKSTNTTNTGSAFIAEISVTPRAYNGYTPQVYQYVVNAPDGFEQLVSESIDFKFEYYDHTGKQSEYVTYLNGVELLSETEVPSNVCQVENYKFYFNPTLWSVVTQSATFVNQFTSPYGSSNVLTQYGVTQPPSRILRPDGTATIVVPYTTHSFAQVGNVLSPPAYIVGLSPKYTGYVRTGWGTSIIGNSSDQNNPTLYRFVTASLALTQRQRKYYPAYDLMRAQMSFNHAYGYGLYAQTEVEPTQTSTPFKVGGYGIGSEYTGTNANQHWWSGWNALRPWKPIFAHRSFNQTTASFNYGTLCGGRFVYTSSWEIHQALGHSVTDNGQMSPTTAGAGGSAQATDALIIQNVGALGTIRYPIKKATVTASWKFFDEFSENYNMPTATALAMNLNQPISASSIALTASFNAYVISASYSPHLTPGTGSLNVLGTSSIDGQIPPNAGAVGITRFDISQSYVTTSGVIFTTAQKAQAYKQRRLYFPQGGPLTGSVFTENGGVYNVKFTIKRYQSGSNTANWFSPDTGSYLMAYIFDTRTDYSVPTEGTPGYYPPSQNIVKIGNQITTNGYNIPAISFYDEVTGFFYDQYDVNLIQYGTNGALIFEPSGDEGKYFGCAIDNVEFCKIGTTSDPYYIKAIQEL